MQIEVSTRIESHKAKLYLMSADRRRSARKWPYRPKSVCARRLPKLVRMARAEETETQELGPEPQRPRTRGECADGPRPCPWVSCRWHLYIDVLATGAIKENFPGLDPEDLDRMPATCALDVADRGGVRLEDVGETMNMTRERIRQIEEQVKRKVQGRAAFFGIADNKRRLQIID